MSLVQHVSAVEGSDRTDVASLRDACDNHSLLSGRKVSLTLSYDPLPKPEQTADRLEAVGAYKVSQVKRLAQVTVGVIICLLASGIVFGFAALKQILVEEGIYKNLCTEHELQSNVRLCYLQDQRLNFIFIIGSVTTNLSALLVGAVLDRYGPFPCGIVSCIILLMGSLCMAFESSLSFDAYPMSFFLLALGGTFSFVPSFQLGNAFPAFQGLIITLVTGAFDASAAVFLAFRLIFQWTDGRFGTRELFLAYSCVPVLIMIANVTLMPRKSYETRAELENDMDQVYDNTLDVHDSDDDLESLAEVYSVRSKRAAERAKSAARITDLIGDERQQVQHEIKEDEKKIASGVWGVLHGLPASKQMLTPWFILIALFTVLQMSRFNFFISTIWSQYHYLLNSSKRATEIVQFFDTALPIGGVVTVPFIGFLLDGTSTVAVLALLVLLSTVIGVLGAIPNATAAYLNVILFVIFRPLYYSAMSDYTAKVFGFATFGTVYGAMICLSGLSLFLQPGLQALVHNVFHKDPSGVNLGLACSGLLVGIALLMYVDTKAREIRRNQFQYLASSAAHAGASLMAENERRSLLSVSLYEGTVGGSGGTTARRRLDFRSPRIRPHDLIDGMSPTPSARGINANLFYNYGTIGSPASAGAVAAVSPAGVAVGGTANEDAFATPTTAAPLPPPLLHPGNSKATGTSKTKSIRLSLQSTGLGTVSEDENEYDNESAAEDEEGNEEAEAKAVVMVTNDDDNSDNSNQDKDKDKAQRPEALQQADTDAVSKENNDDDDNDRNTDQDTTTAIPNHDQSQSQSQG